MTYVANLLLGVVVGFILNFPPKKIQYIILGSIIVLILFGFAMALDAGYPDVFIPDWIGAVFGIIGYVVGGVIAWATKRELKVSWRNE